MSKTKAHVKDGGLAIFAQDASPPTATTLPLEQVRSGTFEIAGEGAVVKLVFRPAGRKTGDVLASYPSRAKAERAMKAIYGSLSGPRPLWKSILRIALFILGGLILYWVLSIAWGLVQVLNGNIPITPPISSQETATMPSEEAPLPVGVPFPVDDFVLQTQDESE